MSKYDFAQPVPNKTGEWAGQRYGADQEVITKRPFTPQESVAVNLILQGLSSEDIQNKLGKDSTQAHTLLNKICIKLSIDSSLSMPEKLQAARQILEAK